MKTCKSCNIAKPLSDFYPKKTGRFGVSSICRPCDNAKSSAYRVRNPEAVKAQRAAFRQENSERLRAGDRARHQANLTVRKAGQKKYRDANKAAWAKRNKEWRENNPQWLREYEQSRSDDRYVRNLLYRHTNRLKWRAYMTEYVRMRKKLLWHAQPAWADRRKIRDIYLSCQLISEMSGIKHHVDHIVPLKGKRVSGLHIETNLQIIPASDNLQKSNSFKTDWEA